MSSYGYFVAEKNGRTRRVGDEFKLTSSKGDWYFHDAIWLIAERKAKEEVDYRSFVVELERNELIDLLHKLDGRAGRSLDNKFVSFLKDVFGIGKNQYKYPEEMKMVSIPVVLDALRLKNAGYEIRFIVE